MKVDRDILNNLCLNITDGEHGTIQNDNDGRYFLLSNKNIINGQIIISDADRRINKESFSKINKRTKLENGDLVISTVGVLGKLAIIKAENLNYDFQRSVGIVKCDEKKINTKYLYYYLNTQFVQNRLNHLSKGAVQKCLFISDLKNLEIDFPDLPTQQKIASVLSALDDKIELNNRINAELEAMAKTLYDYWFVQFDFPIVTSSGVEKPYKTSGGKMVYNEILKREIPEGWEVKNVGDIITKIESGKRPKGGIDKNLKNGIPSLGAESIDRLGVFNYSSTKYIPIEYKEKIKSGIIQNNDILIYKDGAYVGKTTLFRDNFPFEFATINEHVFLVRAKDKYFQEYLLLTLMQKYYFNMMQSLGQKAAQPGLNQEDFKSLKIIVPNDDVLKSFNKQIDLLFGKLFINSKQNQELSALRDWLLPMLMNGQVKVG